VALYRRLNRILPASLLLCTDYNECLLFHHPAGPKTLCNACGVRYQRSQSKAKSNKRQASERARSDRGSPMHARAPKQACLANRAAAGDASKAAADGMAAGHGHGTRSASKGGSRHGQSHTQQQQRQRSAAHAGNNAGRSSLQQQQRQQQMVQHGVAMGAAAAAGVGHNGLYELHFYEDEGSPPGMHTHILEEEEEEEEEEQQQGLLRDVSS
jgi:hypothetical protein